MITTTIDIETLQPDWTPPADDPEKFAPLPEHVPCVVSWLVADPGRSQFDLHTYVKGDNGFELADEREALESLASALRQSKRVVTWNGRGFDMPLLGLRALRLGVDWSFWRGMSHRYGNYKQALIHHDLMDLLGDQGGVRAMPMDGVARLLGLPGKHDISGKDVARVWLEEGGRDRVAHYCQEDVVTTYLIYLRWAMCLEGTAAAGRVWNQVLSWAAECLGDPWRDLAADLVRVEGER